MTTTKPAPSFTRQWANLASKRLGAAVLSASDDFFADKARLIADTEPVFIPGKYDDHGKWMDGWETRRRRQPGHDHCIIRLATRAELLGLDIDTAHFTGNYPDSASVDIRDGEDGAWREVLPDTKLSGNSHHYFPLQDAGPADQLRLNIYPDGGVARLRAYGKPAFDWDKVAADTQVELSALVHGGAILAYNDAHFGSPWPVLTFGRGVDMGDGWETRRRREPGHDWLVFALGAAGIIERIEIDTAHFKGNYPGSFSIQAARMDGEPGPDWAEAAGQWPALISETPLGPDAVHEFGADKLHALGPINAARLNIFPDGGISRIRLFGRKA